jgi:hypothetical protein
MSISISTKDIMSEARYPFRTPNPADTVDTIIGDLADFEVSIDSTQVNSEVVDLSTGGALFGRSTTPCLHIKLRQTKTAELKKFGCVLLAQEFGNLVYLVKYEYLEGGWLESKTEQVARIKKRLKTIDKWMEYTFIQTLGDYIFVEMLRKYDQNFEGNIHAYNSYLTIE